MFPQEFEKDDDSNGHIDFITSASVSLIITIAFNPQRGIIPLSCFFLVLGLKATHTAVAVMGVTCITAPLEWDAILPPV